MLYLCLATYITASCRRPSILPSIQEGIAQKVLRFHVIADSDDPKESMYKKNKFKHRRENVVEHFRVSVYNITA